MIIPKAFSTEAIIPRQELMHAVKLTSVFGGIANEIHLHLNGGKKTVEVSSRDSASGENTYLLSAKVSGGSQELAFNWHYLLDGLKCVPGEEVVFGLNHDNKPALLRSAADTSFFYVVMPILKT